MPTVSRWLSRVSSPRTYSFQLAISCCRFDRLADNCNLEHRTATRDRSDWSCTQRLVSCASTSFLTSLCQRFLTRPQSGAASGSAGHPTSTPSSVSQPGSTPSSIVSHSSSAASAPTSTVGLIAHYGQCGGQGWSGGTVCVSPYTCTVSNGEYHIGLCYFGVR